MIERIVDITLLVMAFQTPYPYLIILGVLISGLIWCGIFLKICNGAFGYMLFTISLVALILAMLYIGDFESPEEDGDLDGRTVGVRYVNRSGLRLSSGDWVLPAGIEYFEGARTWRYNRMAVQETRRVINNSKVLLEWNDTMSGYKIYTRDRVDLGLYLVSKGLARTNGNADDELINAELKAKETHVGAWVQVRRYNGHEISPVLIACAVYLVSLLLALVGYVVVVAVDGI